MRVMQDFSLQTAVQADVPAQVSVLENLSLLCTLPQNLPESISF